MQPTNKDILDALNKHIEEDMVTFQSLRDTINAQTDEDRIAEIFKNTLVEFFESKGRGVKSILITTAVVLGALAVIGGGIKSVLGWIGFHYLIK